MIYSKGVKIWLVIGLLCIGIQVIVGGITRLTESGLSITVWEPVSGAMPPTTDESWIKEFELYKVTPQYQEINEGMDLSEFKFIYFWEFIHRQWARIMGLIFLFPFIYFAVKKKIDRALINKLGVVIVLAVLAATFGWIMVASGLVARPWVNAYKLSMHLCIAFCVFVALLYAYLHTVKEKFIINQNHGLRRGVFFYMVLLWIQIFFGGMMSGMRIGVVFPTWPDMNGHFFPQALIDSQLWNTQSFYDYDQNELLPALTHFIHRGTAYVLFFLGIYLGLRLFKTNVKLWKKISILWILMLISQVLIGILTVINCIGEIPVFLGVMHQAGALLLLCISYIMYFSTTKSAKEMS